jgi:putative serine/threonine protein kinase
MAKGGCAGCAGPLKIEGEYRLDAPELAPVLSYPTGDEKHLERVRSDLSGMGVESVFSQGRVSIGSFWAIGKGWVGVVLLGSLDGKKIALKVRRADADRPSMLNEARMHQFANSVGVGAGLIAKSENAIAMDYVNGEPAVRWLQRVPGPESVVVRRMVSDLLDQCFRLDAAGLDHGELSQSKKHVLVDAGGHPYLLDFETASDRRITRNVMAMAGYLFCKGSLVSALRRHLSWDSIQLMRCLKDYKASKSASDYLGIREAIGL